ncbi:MAG: hypothetical protein K0Q78_2265 [Cellvibrio sp.]|nr:hypothetical protein [Cellvibrio sp.]
MKHLRLIGLLFLGAVISQAVLAEKVYTWTDAKGVVHFGEHPPKDVKATLVKTRTGHSDPTPAQTAATQPKSAQPAAANQQTSLKDPERCAQARENLTVLNSVARIRMPNAEGTLVYLTEEDKAQQRETTQQVIDQACE